MYVIYIDIFFLINMLMDTMIFYISAMVLNRPVKVVRIIAGSILAALISCLVIYMPLLQRLPHLLYVLFTPILPILYLYKPIRVKEFLKIYLICTGTAFVLGGATFSIWYAVNPYSDIDKISIIWLIVIGLGVGSFAYCGFRMIRRRLILPLFEYDIHIVHTNKKVSVRSILDTGNCLYTPLGHKPVIVVTYESLKELFTNEQEMIINAHKDNILELASLNLLGPSYIIPFNSVGCQLGVLLGIEVDKVYIHKDHFEKCIDKCVIAISFNNIFNDEVYHALLHPDFIFSGRD